LTVAYRRVQSYPVASVPVSALRGAVAADDDLGQADQRRLDQLPGHPSARDHLVQGCDVRLACDRRRHHTDADPGIDHEATRLPGHLSRYPKQMLESVERDSYRHDDSMPERIVSEFPRHLS
jgi:hypothetical protein